MKLVSEVVKSNKPEEIKNMSRAVDINSNIAVENEILMFKDSTNEKELALSGTNLKKFIKCKKLGIVTVNKCSILNNVNINVEKGKM